MNLLVSEKHTKERKIAKGIVEKLKTTAAALQSNDKTHKNGVKYIISKKIYENIIYVELENKSISHDRRMIVREFINRKLVPVK
jgi:hypothetical protein